ncbi:flippase [Enterococcus cecorum]|uniref:flippase n=1 Tax=Enterococcus cecorum TaxID=44008 RepID=UPI00200AE397|nr:flippase [Enterococcus cecorum]
MQKYKSVKFNFVMNFILTISNFIFPLITFPYASRILGAQGIGTVTFATSVITYFSMFGMLGIPTYGIRTCAKVRNDKEKLTKTVQEILLLNITVMIVSMILLFISVLIIDKLAAKKFLYLIMSISLIFNVLGVDWLYKALEKYSYITVRSIIFKFISLILLFLFVKNPDDYVIYGAITMFAAVGSNALNFYNLRKLIDIKLSSNLDVKQHIKPIMTFFMLTVSTTIYVNVDTTMLGFIKGDTEVGFYTAAVKVKQILVSVVTSLGTVLLPRLAFYYSQNKLNEFKELVKKAMSFVLLISIPLVVYFIIYAKESILFLSGHRFIPAVYPMQLILPSVIFIGMSNLMGIQILVPTGRERFVVHSTILGAIVDVAINVFTIPLFGASGAAIAGSIAEFSVMMVQIFILKDLILPMIKNIQFWKIIFSIVISSILTIYLIGFLRVNYFFILLTSGILFFCLYLLMLLILKEEFVYSAIKSIKER